MSQVNIYNEVFPLQSYFDTTLLHTAFRNASMNDPITEKKTVTRATGKFIGLHPSSQTPVAFRLLSLVRARGTAAVILTPGQFIKASEMVGFEWGLPAGWMGGGFASLVVADGPEAFAGWSSAKSEVLIHRVRLPIVADGAPGSLTFRKAWPLRFPWPAGRRPVIAAEPTRITLRLRLSSLAAQTDMRILFKSLDDLDIGSDGVTPGTVDVSHIDVTWPPAIAGIAAVAFPVIELSALVLGGDITTVALADISGAGAGGLLVGQHVDIARYGKV